MKLFRILRRIFWQVEQTFDAFGNSVDIGIIISLEKLMSISWLFIQHSCFRPQHDIFSGLPPIYKTDWFKASLSEAPLEAWRQVLLQLEA